MPDSQAFYRVQTVAERFEVTYRTVVDWIRSGKLEAVVLSSGRIRISEAAIQRSLQPLTPKLKIKQAGAGSYGWRRLQEVGQMTTPAPHTRASRPRENHPVVEVCDGSVLNVGAVCRNLWRAFETVGAETLDRGYPALSVFGIWCPVQEDGF